MFEKKAQEMMEKAQMIQVFGEIYDKIHNDYKWNCMRYNDPDAEHPEAFFTEMNEDEMIDYQIAQKKAYKAVLEAIEKLAR